MKIPFNKPHMTGKELRYIGNAHLNGQLSGDGPFTKQCHKLLENQTGAARALLTHSCTAALEMAAVLSNIKPGDEIIMPSFTFVSTANAFVLRGGVPVFVDIRPDTLNLDEKKIERAITSKTVAIVAVHYAGVGCEMEAILSIARKYRLIVIEDAAQGFGSYYKGKHLGTLGQFGALSFHETKNIISGEGGALLINHDKFEGRAEIIREKGTNRSKFFRGQVDKYTWVDIGSSYLPGELIAAFLRAQLEDAQRITEKRIRIWNRYHSAFCAAFPSGKIGLPQIPAHCRHNAHLYYLLLPDSRRRDKFITEMGRSGINTIFHYVPLHRSSAGRKYCRVSGRMTITEAAGENLVRLPLWVDMKNTEIDCVITNVEKFARRFL